MYRLDVNFKIDERNIDSMIGRTAHILLMECEPLIEIIVHKYRDFFCEWINLNETYILISLIIKVYIKNISNLVKF